DSAEVHFQFAEAHGGRESLRRLPGAPGGVVPRERGRAGRVTGLAVPARAAVAIAVTVDRADAAAARVDRFAEGRQAVLQPALQRLAAVAVAGVGFAGLPLELGLERLGLLHLAVFEFGGVPLEPFFRLGEVRRPLRLDTREVLLQLRI